MKVEKQLTEAHGDPVNGVHRRFKTNLYILSQRWQQTHAGEKNIGNEPGWLHLQIRPSFLKQAGSLAWQAWSWLKYYI